MSKIFLVLAAGLMLGGCVIKPYKAPSAASLHMDSLYREAVDTSRNISQIPWREFFENKSLVDLIDSVLTKNLDLKIAVRRIDQSYSQLRSSRAAIAPSFTANVGYGGDFVLNSRGATHNPMQFNGSLGMSWEVDIWGKLLSAKRSSSAALWASEDTYQAVTSSLVAQTATAYYQLVALDLRREMIMETIDNRTAYLSTTMALKESGKVDEVAVQQAISQLEEVRAAMSEVELAISQAENAVSLLLGENSHKIIRVTDMAFAYRDMHSAGYPAQLLAFRPDVRAAEMNYRSKHELWNVARASLYPTLSLSATGTTSLLDAHSVVLNVLSGLTQPIFNGRRLRAQKEIAEAEAAISELEFRKTVLTAAKEVNNALVSINKTGEQAEAQVRQLDALKKAYEYSEELFVNGYATYLDVLVAQTGVFTVQMSLIDTYLANLTSRIELYRALGGGVK